MIMALRLIFCLKENFVSAFYFTILYYFSEKENSSLCFKLKKMYLDLQKEKIVNWEFILHRFKCKYTGYTIMIETRFNIPLVTEK